MAELKSCPFCGGEGKIVPEQVDARTVAYNFVCQNGDCCANVYFDYSDREEAIEAWNTRKPMEAVVAELEKEKENYRDYVNGKLIRQTTATITGLDKAISIVRGKE